MTMPARRIRAAENTNQNIAFLMSPVWSPRALGWSLSLHRPHHPPRPMSLEPSRFLYSKRRLGRQVPSTLRVGLMGIPPNRDCGRPWGIRHGCIPVYNTLPCVNHYHSYAVHQSEHSSSSLKSLLTGSLPLLLQQAQPCFSITVPSLSWRLPAPHRPMLPCLVSLSTARTRAMA